jgi:PAS domain S-box-containing protein
MATSVKPLPGSRDGQPVSQSASSLSAMLWSTDRQLRLLAFSTTGNVSFKMPPGWRNRSLDDLLGFDPSAGPVRVAHRKALEGIDSSFEQSWTGRAYHVYVAPRYNAAGKIDGCLGFAQDLVDYRRAEQALRESEARYRAISELTGTYAYSTRLEDDGALVLEWVIGDFLQITGYPLEEIKKLGGPLTLIHPADRAIAAKRTERLLAGHPHVSEFRIITRSGATRWLRDYGRPVRDEHERWPVRFYGTAQDVTDRKQAEQALRESEERFRLAFEEGPLGMVVLNREGTVLQINRAMGQFLGCPPRELSGRAVETFMPRDESLAAARVLREILAGTRERHCWENRYVHGDGPHVWGRTTATPLHDEDARIIGILVMVEDITNRKQTEEALRRAERLASIGTLAAGIAHEINNPLGAITLSVDAVALSSDQENRDEVVELAMNNIRTSALRCGRIVKSVLQFARDEVSQKTRGDLAEVVRRARDMARSFAANRDVRLRLDVEENLPPIVMNPTEMTQVCVNLISNAVQASKPGSTVTVSLHAAGPSLRLDVVDEGNGIPKEEIDRIFDPFFTTRAQEGGTGLGLSITYGILKQHDGTIDVDSAPGRGTTVSIVLPTAGPAT